MCLVPLSTRCVVKPLCANLRIAAQLAACAALLLTGGCELASPRLPGPPLDPASVAAHYPSVEFSGAQTLADFQNPAQAHWFSIVSDASLDPSLSSSLDPSTPVQPTIATPPGSPEARSLAFDLNSAAERLVCDLQRAASDGAAQDWSEFGALLLRLWGPPDGADAILLLRSGGPTGFGETVLPLRLSAGWNLLTVDLDSVSRGHERRDMRQLEIIPVIGSKPATFHLDDLVLADRTQWYTGQDAGPGELYAYSRGPRVFVGVHERFELVFAEGAISAWYATGPGSLAGLGGLGPWPVFVANDWSGSLEQGARGLTLAGPLDPGMRPAVTQRVLEASATRVVLEGSRELLLAADAADVNSSAELRQCRSRYVVYRDGRVFVQISLEAGSTPWPSDRLGWAVLLDSGTDFAVAESPPATPEDVPANFALVTSNPPGADLLWAPHAAGDMRWRRFLPRTGSEPSLLLAGETQSQPVMLSTHLLWFCPAGFNAEKAEEIASNYQEPLALQPQAGHLVTDVPADLNHDGYNESEGCYELALQRGRLRFDVLPGSTPRHEPLFRINGTDKTRCWVYADGQALPVETRDAAGQIMFTLPGIIRSPRTIEVYALPEQPELQRPLEPQ